MHALKEMGGWKSLEMVQRYAHLVLKHLIQPALKINNIMTSKWHSFVTTDNTREEMIKCVEY